MNQAGYVNLLSELLPLVSYDASGALLKTELDAEASIMAMLDTLVTQLLTAIDPQTATNLLVDWERVYNLKPAATDNIQQRRERVMAALAETGGLSRNYFISLAKTLGYDITIEEMDEPMWRWVVHVHGAPEQTYFFRVGESTVGERLEDFGDPGLEALFTRLKPAHTECLFVYSEGNE